MSQVSTFIDFGETGLLLIFNKRAGFPIIGTTVILYRHICQLGNAYQNTLLEFA